MGATSARSRRPDLLKDHLDITVLICRPPP
jgi:hypothetical protein